MFVAQRQLPPLIKICLNQSMRWSSVAELAFSASDLAQMRFAVSPMWEVGTSFKLLSSGSAHPVHHRWVEQVRPRVAAAGLGKGWLTELIRPASYVPVFLNPAPAGPSPDLPAELAEILATPVDRVRHDLDRLAAEAGRLGPRLRALHAEPRTHLARLTEEIQAYWELALAPYWARIRAVLDADISYRARQVAERGAGYLAHSFGLHRTRPAHPGHAAGPTAARLPSARHRHPVGVPAGGQGRRYRGSPRSYANPVAGGTGGSGLHHRAGPPHRALASRCLSVPNRDARRRPGQRASRRPFCPLCPHLCRGISPRYCRQLAVARLGEAFVSQHGEQLQFLVAFGARGSGEHEECL